MQENIKKNVGVKPTFFGAEGGTWTHTLSPTMDFESIASAIPPLRLVESFIIIIDKKKKSKRL